MRIVIAHNWYRHRGGEDGAVDQMKELLEQRGHSVRMVDRDSKTIDGGALARVGVALTGSYSIESRRAMARVLDEYRPDLVHAHNVFPLLTPSVLAECRRRRIPVVMTCHNYRLTCPALYHLSRGAICERCVGGREYWCVLRNCRGSLAESLTFAGWGAVTRKFGLLKKNVTVFLALTEFFRKRLLAMGIDDSRVQVLPNMVQAPEQLADGPVGDYVAFSGRLSPEKGATTLLDAAARLPHVQVKLAGDGPCLEDYRSRAPSNVTFLGRLGAGEMASFYQNARMLVMPSVWFEMCPLVLSEAMGHGIPVIASRVGGVPELVDEGRTGLLFEMGDSVELANRIDQLWNDPERCRRYGSAGRQKALQVYSEDAFYRGLMRVYEHAGAIMKSSAAP